MLPKLKYAQNDGAPHIPADFIIGVGHVKGNLHVDLAVQDFRYVSDSQMEAFMIPTAHLRMTPQVAQEMIRSIQQVLDELKEQAQARKNPVKPRSSGH